MQPARSVSYGCTMLLGTQKKGVLKPDANGYYTVPLGAYGAHNSAGMFYDLTSALPFFKQGSPLLRMIEKGVLCGEYKHPERPAGMSDRDYIMRIRKVDEDRISHHIRRVYLMEGQKDDQGRPIMAVIGEVRPEGPYGHIVKDALENPDRNVYFSVRSLTMDDMMRGIKYTKDIITWDYVNEGGIYTANKYYSPALETFNEVAVTPTMLWSLAEEQKKNAGFGLESAGTDYDTLLKNLGWDKGRAPKSSPIYTKW